MRKPNVLFILTDDHGYGDLGCMGARDLSTPHLDRLAASGCLFQAMYAGAPESSPSRAALLTGRYPANAGVRADLAESARGLSPGVPSLAAALREAGYRTGLIGKWHLGMLDECRPNANGFDVFRGFLSDGVDPFSHIRYWGLADGQPAPAHDLWEDGKEAWESGTYITHYITEQTIRFIRESAPGPFFAVASYGAPHAPAHAPKEYVERFSHLAPDRRLMAAMLCAVDEGVGALAATLFSLGLTSDTLVYFQSVCGPSREARNRLDGRDEAWHGGACGGLAGHRDSLFEGGIRVPALISRPGRIPAGRRISEPCVAMDLYPTVLRAAGCDAGAWETDGIDLTPLIETGTGLPRGDLFWESGEQTAIRRGNYKLIINVRPDRDEPLPARFFLSDLSRDPGERKNLADEMPDLTSDMLNAALDWRKELVRSWRARFAKHYSTEENE
jgi:arylsulfatase A-like enzyme